jgi:hypothetical protein
MFSTQDQRSVRDIFSLTINSDKMKQAILTALGDKEMLKILDAAMQQCKSVNDIIRETGVPHTTGYRKVNWLLQEGLLAVQRTRISPDGKKYSEVRSVLRSFNVKYELNILVVEGEQNFNPMGRTASDFFSLDESTSQ